MALLVTPRLTDPGVAQLCKQVRPHGGRAVLLPVTPEKGCEPLDCFRNVQKKVYAEGGRIQYGWSIWMWPRVFVEAEHHAVYARPDGGGLLDITPSAEGYYERLFLPDDDAVYDFENEGIRRKNIRLALSNDQLVRRFFAAAEERNRLLNSIPGIGLVTATGNTAARLQANQQELAILQLQLAMKYTGPNDLCFCGSGGKFKRCHGRRA